MDPVIEVCALLADLRKVGARVTLVADSFEVKAPTGVLTDDLKARLRELREGVTVYLKEGRTWPCSGCGQFAFRKPGVTCWWCRNRAVRET